MINNLQLIRAGNDSWPGRVLRDNWFVLLGSFLFFLLTVVAFFPGEMTADTYDQLIQANVGVFLDGHPPIMAAFWRFLFWFSKNPGILFVLHNICYWFFWCLLSMISFKNWKLKLFVLGLGALPPLWCQVIVVWKDTELSICLLGAYLFLILAKWVHKTNWQWKSFLFYLCLAPSVALFFYSCAVRLNSLPALVPLAWYLFKIGDGKFCSIRIFFGVPLFLAVNFGAVHFFNYDVLKAHKYYVSQALKIQDIVSVFIQTDREELLPSYWKILNPKIDPETLRKDNQNEDLYSSTGKLPVEVTHDLPQLSELNGKWLESIRLYPWIYLQHRWKVFCELLRIGEKDSYFPFQLNMAPSRFNLVESGNPSLRVVLKYYFWKFGNSVFFKGWPYLLLLLAIIGFHLFGPVRWNLGKEASFFSALSAFLYAAGYFFYAPAFDFRLLYPTVTLTVFSLVMMWCARNPIYPENLSE